jgi:hypothetical protein
MRRYFFGVYTAGKPGHFLVGPGGAWVGRNNNSIPFNYDLLDGMIFPPGREQLGVKYHNQINGWTILSMWDRTGDTRGGSNASFLAEGLHSQAEMEAIAADSFPEQWNRIHSANAP